VVRRIHICVLLLAVVWLGAAAISRAGGGDFKVIVHPDNPIAALDRGFLRDVYLKKITDWDHGKTVRPVDLGKASPVRDRFSQDVLKKSRAQLRSYWNQRIFSGKGVPPPEVESTAAVIAYVLANPGAVAYLPADVDPGRAKVVTIR